MNTLTIGELRVIMEGLPDSTPVVAIASDHRYRAVGASLNTIMVSRHGHWYEDFGDLNPDGCEQDKRIDAVILE